MPHPVVSALLAAACLSLAAPVAAKAIDDAGERTSRPRVIQQLYDCRAIADAAQRLACFDRQVAELATAEERKQVRVADKEEVERARRGLFGFSIPRIGLFGGEEIESVELAVRSARTDQSGKWVMRMEDGSTWVQTDTRPLRRAPKAGQKVKIRSAALGSYFANVEGQTAIRVKRSD